MMFSRAWLDSSLVLIASLQLLSLGFIALTVSRPHELRGPKLSDGWTVAVLTTLSAGIALAVTQQPLATMLSAGAAMAASRIILHLLPRLSPAGAIQMATAPLALAFVPAWTWLLLREQGFPVWSQALTLAGVIPGLALLAFGFATRLIDDAVLTHAAWSRPTSAPAPVRGAKAYAPKVSIHVPCYAEPPAVVIQTLKRLAELRYPNYEVLVCDNNTPDEALWRPVQRYCAMLNARAPGRFKFHHVAPLAGAKAGALNYLLERTAKDADLVAVVDADYLAEPDFLSRLSPFFADGKVGFVQTPHDYRPDGSAYQAMCHWEYMPPNKIGLASLNEYDCAYTIGTMCILRKDAIADAGGWAEWCLTEDSEISVRIRALGFEGMYVNETFGRGLIPETFEDYKKQRFRWTAGPVQQLLTHWRLFLPAALGGSPNMHGAVKLMEINRSLVPILAAFQFLLGLAGGALAFGLTVSGRLPPLELPTAFWAAGVLTAVAGVIRVWQQYRLSGCSAPHLIAGAEIARLSLALVKARAALTALSGRPLAWRRTPKFAATSCAARALWAAAPETVLGLAFAVLMIVPLQHAAELGVHVAFLSAAGCLTAAVGFLTAPVMALISEQRLRQAQEAEEGGAHPAEAALSRAA